MDVNAAGLRQRLVNQRLTRSPFSRPEDVVSWLGAVQSQDYAGAKWALGMRASGVTDSDVERAFDEGRILRTHVLRPTWHFVSPADIRWILSLSAPRVHAANAHYYRKCELGARTFARGRTVVERALAGGKQLTRSELAARLSRAGIKASGMRLAYLMMHAELDGVICSGKRRGKQFTYALLEERVPRQSRLDRDEALATLTLRYFRSHGPATVRDFVWWSGLTVRDARTGIQMAGSALAAETIGDLVYWSAPAEVGAGRASGTTHLLPNYDEYLIAYKDRDLAGGSSRATAYTAIRRDAFGYYLIMNGRLAGTWRRTLERNRVLLEVAPYQRLARREWQAIETAGGRHGQFMSMPVTLADQI